MTFLVPDLKWYTGRSRELNLISRCPFATVEVCPRYYQSLSLLWEAGSTRIEKQEDERLLKRWEQSDLWPKTQEQATSVSRSRGEASYFSNFCPEVTFQRFGYFASYLGRYADDIDQDVAHAQLSNHSAAENDWSWAWASIEPQHYSDCSLFSVLSHRHNKNEQRDAMKRSTAYHTVVNIDTVGNIGDITDNAKVTIDQSTTYSNNDLATIKDLITEIDTHHAELEKDLDSEKLENLELAAKKIHEQFAQQPPNTSIIGEGLRSLRTILEGATANVLASGWLKVIQALI